MIRRNNDQAQNILKTRWRQQLLLTVLLLIFGFILMSHIQSVDANVTRVNLMDQYKSRQQELDQYEQQNEKLLQENAQLTKAKEQAIEDLLTDGNEQLLADFNKVSLLAGFTEAQGRGLMLTLNDKKGYDILNDPLDAIVHDADVRYAVDLLRNNGAAGISINGYRIVNSTYILCIGPTILVNLQRLVPPYAISAIGDAEQMQQALEADSYFSIRRMTGIVVQAQVSDTITLPAFNEVDQLDKYIHLLEVSQK